MGPVTPPPPGSPWECLELCPLQVEQSELQNLFEKYVPYLIDVIVEGIVDGRQGEKLKMIVPQTSLNMVRTSPRGLPGAVRRQAGSQRCGRDEGAPLFLWSCARQAPPAEPGRGVFHRSRAWDPGPWPTRGVGGYPC